MGIAAGAAVWVRRLHPRNKIHQLRAQLPEKHAGGFVVGYRRQLRWRIREVCGATERDRSFGRPSGG